MSHKVWHPKDQRSVAIIKLTLWSGLLVWSIFTAALGILFARQFAILTPEYLSADFWGNFLSHWLGPTWIVFTTLMVIWAVLRFAYKRLRGTNK